MTDPLERRLRQELREAAAFEPDLAAARAHFGERRRHRRLHVTPTVAVAAAAFVVLAVATIVAATGGSESRLGVTAGGGSKPAVTEPLGAPQTPAAGETMPGSTTTTSPASAGTGSSPGPSVVGSPAIVHPAPVPPSPTVPPTSAPPNTAPPTTAPPSTSPPTTGPPPTPATVTVTEQDSGKSLTLRSGDTLVVRLNQSSGYQLWTDPASSDEKVVHRTAVSANPGGYVMASFAAAAPGTANVTAVENPSCYPQCLMPSRQFEVTVTVTG